MEDYILILLILFIVFIVINLYFINNFILKTKYKLDTLIGGMSTLSQSP